jgi:succinate dehydrogenase/fumarate reductase cytochrome b subunit
MLDKIVKAVVFSCLVLFGIRVLLSDFLEHMSTRALFSSGFGVLILTGAGILAYWKISDYVKGRSPQNNP